MEKQSLEIDRVLICTTAHATQSDASKLDSDSARLVVYSMLGYGWMIKCDDASTEIDASPLSTNLKKLLHFAAENDCQWLRLDRDAEEIDGFKTFSW